MKGLAYQLPEFNAPGFDFGVIVLKLALFSLEQFKYICAYVNTKDVTDRLNISKEDVTYMCDNDSNNYYNK